MQLFKLTHTQDRYNFDRARPVAKDIYLGEPTKGHYLFIAAYVYISTLFTKKDKLLLNTLEFYLKKIGKLTNETS